MSALVPSMALAAMTPEMLDRVVRLQDVLLRADQVDIQTEHMIHAGMYARTVRVPAGVAFTGALIKRATLLIIHGKCNVLLNDGVALVDGYAVLAGGAGRKQAFVTLSDIEMTMLFPTAAKSVEEAEAEFTDEADMLLSRRQSNETVTITGE